MQFVFMPGCCITDVIYMLQQMQEKHLIMNKKIYFTCADLEKAFDRVPGCILRWAMRKLDIDEWNVRLLKLT